MLLTGQNSIASFIDELSQTSLSRETIDSTTDDGTIRDDKVNQTIAVAQTQQFAYAHENHEPIESETVAESADADEPPRPQWVKRADGAACRRNHYHKR